MRLKATKEVYYQSRTRHVGDEFDASDSDGRILVGIGKAIEVKRPVKEASLATRNMVAQSTPPDEPPKAQAMTTEQPLVGAEGRPRRYMRRDMRAKE